MKRTFATLGVVGLAALVVAAPASADRGNDNAIMICHAGSGKNAGTYSPIMIDVNGLHGHDHHPEDIIPPNEFLSNGQNWGSGAAIHAAGCVDVDDPVAEEPVVNPPVVNPPVVNPPGGESPAVETPVVAPVVEPPAAVVEPPAAPVVQQPLVAPAAGAVAPQAQTAAPAPQAPVRTGTAASATASLGTNQGYNAQTAVSGAEGSSAWLGGLGALVAAGAAVAVRRRSAGSMAG
ncbi:hypothetical protein FDW83_08095 [Pseudarthrobacter sp. NamE2]|uniref:hypothetical protein n=1 Tax=Pseudarthrobacter sp. NamE2 TaxID=2576838 RepID=UPI0010FE539A|nr:hypothetical protein [Pseudarthrobacter sp. NamE2]TLM83931.1 hypothetical protein FDW83_08095 [Pseudarthrobacter sp. NamE2]